MTETVTKINEGQYKLISNMVSTWLELHKGETFDLEAICRQLNITDKDRRNLVTIKLAYEIKHKNLEKSNRVYRYIDNTIKYIDWINVNTTEALPILWPDGNDGTQFGFDGRITISPGDIIVIAGVSNTGKTTFCQNFLWKNMDLMPCTMMGNEITPSKFKRRVGNMTWANPLRADGSPKFELIERRENWKDIIRPNNINIIDWINLGDNFYEIGKIIEGIQSRLNDGIALIALQKDPNKTMGMGGNFGQHLASLYLTMDFNRLTIIKAKEWHDYDPNNKMYGFTITNHGCDFENIRLIKKCPQCYATGKSRGGQCDKCAGTGYVDV